MRYRAAHAGGPESRRVWLFHSHTYFDHAAPGCIAEARSLSIVLRHWPLGNYCRSPFASLGFGGLIQTALGGSAG